jgi:diaminopimelate epimerase
MSDAARKGIPFAKMSGLGNDFIVVDDRNGALAGLDPSFLARKLCAPRVSIGADELMVIESSRGEGDFFMRTFNPDGAEVKMCGNASRCVARYAFAHGIAPARMLIGTLGGPVGAVVEGERVRVGLSVTAGPRRGIALKVSGRSLVADWLEISGAPHAVVRVDGIMAASDGLVRELGSGIRHDPAFPGGVNVNLVEAPAGGVIAQRTYERGIEGETLACGTGATASALVAALDGLVASPVLVRMRGGDLDISFALGGASFSEVWLGGGVRFVAEGLIHPEAWDW